jgi:hypothetical protein
MAIEDDDIRDRKVWISDDGIRDRELWVGVACHWYPSASDKASSTVIWYHHLVIAARTNVLQSATAILTCQNSLLVGPSVSVSLPRSPLHFLHFSFNREDLHRVAFPTVNGHLYSNQFSKVSRKFMEQGYYTPVTNNVTMPRISSNNNVCFCYLRLHSLSVQEISFDANSDWGSRKQS